MHHRPARGDAADPGRGRALAARRSVCAGADDQRDAHRVRRRYVRQRLSDTHTHTHTISLTPLSVLQAAPRC